MKLLIAGSRDLKDAALVRQAVEESGWIGEATEIVHGGARGADSLAHDLFYGVLPIKVFPADWKKHGRAAGPIRNTAMADYADRLVALPCGESRGTHDMINKMRFRGKPVYVKEL